MADGHLFESAATSRCPQRTYSRVLYAFELAVIAIILIALQAKGQAAGTEAIATVRPAMVSIFLPADNAHWSGFVVDISSKGSDIVTAAQTIHDGSYIQVYFDGDLKHPHDAHVVGIDRQHNLALLHTDASAPAQAVLADAATKGDLIGILGYPAQTAVAMAGSGEVKAEASLGEISSARINGTQLGTNAYIEPGYVGAPVFRQDNAATEGIVTDDSVSSSPTAFQATGIALVRKFLTAFGVDFKGTRETTSANPSTASDLPSRMPPLREVPGAGQLFSIATVGIDIGTQPSSDLYTVATANAIKAYIDNDLQGKLGTITQNSFKARLNFPAVDGPQDYESAVQMAKGAAGPNFVGTLLEGFTLHNTQSFLQQSIEAESVLLLVDPFGDVVYRGKASKTIKRNALQLSLSEKTAQDLIDDVALAALSDLMQASEKKGDSGGLNFSRFGIPLGIGQISAFFSIRPERQGARVVSLYPYGTAAQAHLHVGDLIVSLDGQDLANRTPAEIEAMFDNHTAATYSCTLAQPDGHAVLLSFEAKNLRWYLEHKVNGNPR